jgi:hypothetical protein
MVSQNVGGEFAKFSKIFCNVLNNSGVGFWGGEKVFQNENLLKNLGGICCWFLKIFLTLSSLKAMVLKLHLAS